MDISSTAPAAYSPNTPEPTQYLAAKAAISVKTPSTDVAVESAVAMKGKASAPGQIAMSLKAEIAASGAELAVNIQGKLASSIAKGADAQSLVLAFSLSVDAGDVVEPEGEIPVEEPPVIEADITEPDDDGGDLIPIATDAVDDFGLASAEVALALLTGTVSEDPVLADVA